MKGEVKGAGFNWQKWIKVLVFVGIVWLIWSVFFSYEDCRNKVCFNENLKDCDRAKFIGGEGMIFEYMIKGESGNECEIEVKLVQGELNNADSMKLEGHVMTCVLPFGVVVAPESDIGVCHGLLKEGLQDLIITKLHTYLVQNLGRLNLEVAGVPEIN